MNYGDGVISTTHSNQLESEIGFIEGVDFFQNGSGSISMEGGVGSRNFTLTLESGRGEDLYYSVYFYGLPPRGN